MTEHNTQGPMEVEVVLRIKAHRYYQHIVNNDYYYDYSANEKKELIDNLVNNISYGYYYRDEVEGYFDDSESDPCDYEIMVELKRLIDAGYYGSSHSIPDHSKPLYNNHIIITTINRQISFWIICSNSKT